MCSESMQTGRALTHSLPPHCLSSASGSVSPANLGWGDAPGGQLCVCMGVQQVCSEVFSLNSPNFLTSGEQGKHSH